MAAIQYVVTSLVALLQCARYGPIERMAAPRLVSACSGSGALLYVSLDAIKL